MTVFQVMTGDNWNAVMADGANFTSHIAAVYFIACIIFGQFILLNLFVAILLSQMESEGEDKEYYENELKEFKHFRKYHDTYTVGQDKNGRTHVVSISNMLISVSTGC